MRTSALIRKRLIAGFMTILPLGVTIWFLKIIFQILISIFRAPLSWAAKAVNLPEPNLWQQALFSIVAMGVMLFAIGSLIQYFLGRRVLGWMDTLMMSVPGVKSIYGATKQVMNALQSGKGGSFKEVVLVPWPHPGSKAVGFVSHRGCPWAAPEDSRRVAVYVPSTPNPTSGFVIMLDESDIQPLSMSLDEALTWVVTGGAVQPGGSDKTIDQG
ncbi:MAG: DUF502 domain-containing protein [Holophagales bacterium]|nr:DUF502 domain-containing protein [Holophagales bacterium]